MKLSELHLSCCNGDIQKVKEYLTKNNLNEINIIYEEKQDGEWEIIERKELTPLICAIENNHLNIIKYLYEQGANIHLFQ
jgi:ankyrin repeat protein